MLLKWSKKASCLFFYAAHNVLLTPLPFHFYFSPLPQFYYFPSSIFSSFIPSSSSIISSIVLFSLLILELSLSLQIWYFPTSSSFLISLLHNFHFLSSILISLLLHLLIYSICFSIHKYVDLISTLPQPKTQLFFSTTSWIVKLYKTTTTLPLLPCTTTTCLFTKRADCRAIQG